MLRERTLRCRVLLCVRVERRARLGMRGGVMMRVLIWMMMTVVIERDKATVSAVWRARASDLAETCRSPHSCFCVFENSVRKQVCSLELLRQHR